MEDFEGAVMLCIPFANAEEASKYLEEYMDGFPDNAYLEYEGGDEFAPRCEFETYVDYAKDEYEDSDEMWASLTEFTKNVNDVEELVRDENGFYDVDAWECY